MISHIDNMKVYIVHTPVLSYKMINVILSFLCNEVITKYFKYHKDCVYTEEGTTNKQEQTKGNCPWS